MFGAEHVFNLKMWRRKRGSKLRANPGHQRKMKIVLAFIARSEAPPSPRPPTTLSFLPSVEAPPPYLHTPLRSRSQQRARVQLRGALQIAGNCSGFTGFGGRGESE